MCAASCAPAQVDFNEMDPQASLIKGLTAGAVSAGTDMGAQDGANGRTAVVATQPAEATKDKAFTQTQPETKRADAIRITVAAPTRTRRQVLYVRTKRKQNRKKLSTLHLIYGK